MKARKANVGKKIDLDAHFYQKHSQQQYDRARVLFKPEDFSKTAHVLDVGCGDGKITAEIAALVPEGRVLGIDSSPNMVRLAKESFHLSNLDFQCVKGEEISTQESFDNIFCFNCLLWIRKPKEALDRLSRLLKPGATLTVLTYLKESSYVDFLEKTLEQFPEYKKLSAARTMLTLEDHLTILETNGLDIQMFEVEDLTSCYSNQEELIAYLEGWIRSYVPMPDDQQKRFLHQAAHNCFNTASYKEGNTIHLPYRTLTIKAKRKNPYE
ncbi:MAG: methyltransferase domain-containing protein [Halobacteriovoraceae bacterium]|nr:methyltransferase domain-containing protein [Halobacteriovoraceae bacterium]